MEKEMILKELRQANEYVTMLNKVRPENQEDHENIRVHLMKIEEAINKSPSFLKIEKEIINSAYKEYLKYEEQGRREWGLDKKGNTNPPLQFSDWLDKVYHSPSRGLSREKVIEIMIKEIKLITNLDEYADYFAQIEGYKEAAEAICALSTDTKPVLSEENLQIIFDKYSFMEAGKMAFIPETKFEDVKRAIINLSTDNKGEEKELEVKTERNAEIIGSFMEHCKEKGIEIPNSAFESYFGS